MAEDASSTTPAPLARQPLSVGDAIVIVFLLLFILVWVGGWLFLLVRDPGDPGDVSIGAVIFLFLIVGLPPIWAGDRIKDITK